MQFLRLYPVVRLLVPFIAGIVTALMIQPEPAPMFSEIVTMTVILLSCTWFILFKSAYGARWVFGSLVTCVLFILGFTRLVQQDAILQPMHFSNQKGIEWIVKVTDPPREKERSWKIIT